MREKEEEGEGREIGKLSSNSQKVARGVDGF